MFVAKTLKVIDHFQVRIKTCFGGLLRIGFKVIDAADAIEYVEAEALIVAQESAKVDQVGGRDNDEGILRLQVLGLNTVPELLFKDGNDFGRIHGWFG